MYRLISGRHWRTEDGVRTKYEPGDLVDLTDLEIEAFGDKFELVADGGGTASGLTGNEVIDAHGEKLGQALLDSGFSSLAAIEEADDKDLLSVPGVGKATLEKLRP